eukprot:46439_1
MKHAQKLRSLSTCTILLAVSLLTTPINCQYLITANNSHCLAIGLNSITNNSQLFWCNIAHSDHCVNWALERHFRKENEPIIYNGKFYMNGIGANAIHQESYSTHKMLTYDTTFNFSQGQSTLPSAQRSISVGYDSTNNIIELVGGWPDGYLHVEYFIDNDTFYNRSRPFHHQQKSFGHSYVQIGEILYTGIAYKFDVLNESYTTFSEPGGDPPDWRFGCLAALDSNYIFFHGAMNIQSMVYSIKDDASIYGPDLQENHSWGSCQVVNNYLYVISGHYTTSVEKLYIDTSNINGHSFETLSDSCSVTAQSIRSEVIGNNIFIQTFNSSLIEVLDTVTERISVIGSLTQSNRYVGSILVHNVWYLFGGTEDMTNTYVSNKWYFYDFSADTDATVDEYTIADGMVEFELDLSAQT